MAFAIDAWIALARLKAALGGNTVRFTNTPDGSRPAMRYDSDEPRGPLSEVIDIGWSEWVVYPSGLALPIPRVCWFWLGTDVRLGTAEQCHRFARPGQAWFSVRPDHVHGTCVRIDTLSDYRFVQARGFPAYAGF